MRSPARVGLFARFRLYTGRRWCLCLFVCLAVIFLLVTFIEKPSRSEARAKATNRKNAEHDLAHFDERISVAAAGRRNPTINLSDGRAVLASYAGPEELQQALSQNQAQPLSLASADFDEDGLPDLVTGYGYQGRGIVSLLRGNVDSIYANAPEAQQRKLAGGFTEAPFLSPALLSPLPTAPDFIGAGDFDADGHWDIVIARRGGSVLYYLLGDGHGHFPRTQKKQLAGAVTAFITGDVNRADGLTDVIVGVSGPRGAQTLIYEGPNGAMNAEPEAFAVLAPVTALAVGQLDSDQMSDIAVGAGRSLLLIHGRDRKLSLNAEHRATAGVATVEQRQVKTSLTSLTTGEFTADGRTDLAWVNEKGEVWVLAQPEATAGRPRASLQAWLGQVAASVNWSGVSCLSAGRVGSVPLDSLIGLDSRGQRLRVLTNSAEGPQLFAKAGKFDRTNLQFAETTLPDVSAPMAVLSLRLNGDALDDLVVLQKGTVAPVVVASAPSAIITVNSSADTNLRDDVLTLREAILLANEELLKSDLTQSEQLQVQGTPAPGLDEVRFNIPAGNIPSEAVTEPAHNAVVGTYSNPSTNEVINPALSSPSGPLVLSPGFTNQTPYSLPSTNNSRPHSVAAFNRLGRPGLAVTSRPANSGDPGDSVTVFYANPIGGGYDGTFGVGVTYPLKVGSQPQRVVVGNLGQLNVPCLVVAASGVNQVAVLLGNSSDGTFQPAKYYNTDPNPNAVTFPESVTLGDFNADKNLDIAVANYANSTVSVLLGNSDGSFRDAVRVADLGSLASPEFIVAGDFDGDEKLDLATCTSGNVANGKKVNVLIGNGDGSFQAPAIYPAGSNPMFMVADYFNGDGKLDLATSSSPGAVSVLLSSPTGTFPTKVDYAAGTNPLSISAADVNLDGFPDLVVASNGDDRVSILLNNTDGTFQQPVFSTTAVAGSGPLGVAVGDFNLDGRPDIAVANNKNNTLGVMLNTTVDLCGFSLNPTSQNFGASGGNGNITVTAAGTCTWAATSNATWIHSTSSGTGNGTATYNVDPNSGAARSGTIAIGGHLFTVTQDNGCAFAISPTVKNAVAGPDNGFVSVTTSGGDCSWTAMASNNAPWLSIASGQSGTGNGTVNYNVAPNSGAARTGTITIAGQIFTVLQNAGGVCTYTIDPVSQGFGPASGSGAVNVTAPFGCDWKATSNNPAFITITVGGTGSGNGTVSYTVAANGTGSPRSGTITITGGNTFTVVQGTSNSNLRSITLTSPLPQITDPITIDGWTQGGAGYTGPPLIEINGQNLAAQSGLLTRDGLRITAGSSTIRGLALNRFTSATRDAAIRLTTNGHNVIEGCYLGSDANGTNAFAPANTNGLASGITIQSSSDNQIGGTTVAKRNLISGIDGAGITIGNGSTRNLVQGNYIGTDVTGSVRLTDTSGNGYQRIGVYIQNASGNTVGGTIAGAGNLISGNLDYGVFAQDESSNNLVQGNIIGANGAGAAPVPNGNAGVFLYRPSGTLATTDNTIGGTSPAARNLISGNEPYGVVVGVGATGTLVQGNYIGTNASGTTALANTYGVTVTQATGSTVGGNPVAAPSARNVISGNRLTGIYVGFLNNGQAGGTGVTVQGNYVGTDTTGDHALGNSRDGIFVEVQSASDTIQSNRIAYNGNSGVRIPNVTDVPGTPGVRIQILDNLIYANAVLGIDLGDAGITPNDPLDTDIGANLQQNFPVLTSIGPNSTVGLNRLKSMTPLHTDAQTVNGTLNSTPNSTFTVHWYFANVASCSNNQATSVPLVFGRVPNVTTNAQGNAQFSFPFDFPVGISSGIINTTATDSNGNTSEFSACLPVNAPTPPTVQFSAANYNVGEGDGAVTVTVTRSGDTSSATTVDFATGNNTYAPCNPADPNNVHGQATQNCDFIRNQGTLTFNPGDTSETFSVLIVDDTNVEGPETFPVTLSAAVGGSVGAINTATVTIADNDTAQATSPVPFRFWGVFTGAQETPPNNSNGSGVGVVLLTSNDLAPPTMGQAGLQFSNLGSTETGAHIHGPGAPGAMASIIFPLPTTNPVINFQLNGISPQQVSEMRSGLDYMNVHSQNFQNGEIRGQLSWNPTLEQDYFVRQHYRDFLQREPDPGGFTFWTSRISPCLTDAQCLHDKTISVSNAFFYELEYQQTGAYAYRLFREAFGNTQPQPNPDPSNPTEANKIPSYDAYAALRARVVGGANLTAGQQDAANVFVNSSQFQARYPASLTLDQFVDAILNTIMTDIGVNLTSQRTALIALGSRAAVVYRLANDDLQGGNGGINNRAFIDAEYNRAFVVTQYFGYLRRDGDIGGILFWKGQVDSAPLRNVAKQNAMVCSFITSVEYQKRFGPNAPRSNDECPR